MSTSDKVREMLASANKVALRKTPTVQEQYAWFRRRGKAGWVDPSVSEVEMRTIIGDFIAGMVFTEQRLSTKKILTEDIQAVFIDYVARNECI
jgi:hypothetical protein